MCETVSEAYCTFYCALLIASGVHFLPHIERRIKYAYKRILSNCIVNRADYLDCRTEPGGSVVRLSPIRRIVSRPLLGDDAIRSALWRRRRGAALVLCQRDRRYGGSNAARAALIAIGAANA